MRFMRWMSVFAGVSLVVCGAVVAEGAQRGGFSPSFRGGWHPVVGSGGVYHIEEQGEPAVDWEVTVVGQEGDGYWIETHITAPEEATTKMLVSPGATPQSMIVKSGVEPAMELPMNMMGRQRTPTTDVEATSQRIGTEQVTTAAGTFTCEHYQSNDDSGVTDVWVNTGISPYGVVKTTTSTSTMELTRVVTNAKTRITETPQKFLFPAGFADMLNNR